MIGRRPEPADGRGFGEWTGRRHAGAAGPFAFSGIAGIASAWGVKMSDTIDETPGSTVIAGTCDRILQVRKPGNRCSAKVHDAFFAALAQTCNVTHAAAVAGIDPSWAYQCRRTRPEFAESWRQALILGYERLEEELLRLTLASLAGTGDGTPLLDENETLRPGSGLPRKANGAPDMQLALTLLNRHRATVEGTGKAAMAGRRATPEETDALLRKKLDALAKRLKSVES